MDEGLDVSPGLLEDHATNGPFVGIGIGVLDEEVICENASRRFVPSVTCSPSEMESECVGSATLPGLLRVPVCYVLVRDSIFEPIILVDQGLHVVLDASLESGVTIQTRA